MNSKFIQQARVASRFAEFMLHSGNRYRIHSPFIYQMIGEVVRVRKPVEGEKAIEQIRKECLRSSEVIMKTDYGSGGRNGEGVVYPVSIAKIADKSLSSARHARRLYHLVRFMKSGNILEIGTSLGLTTAYLALANPGARIITLEGCPELCRLANEHFQRLGITNIEVIEGRFEDTLLTALDRLGRIDLVLCDGNHRKEAMLDYFGKCLAYSHNNTTMIFDDIHGSEEMEEAWELVKGNQQVRISLDFFYSGWLFFRKESSREHFRLRYI